MFRTNWIINNYYILKQPNCSIKKIIDIQKQIHKIPFNKKIKINTNLTPFINTSYIEYNDIINRPINKQNINQIIIFLKKSSVLQKFITEFSEIIGMFHTVPIYKNVHKTARLHRDLENLIIEYYKNNIWKCDNFYINLNQVNWKQFVPLNVDILKTYDSKIKFSIGLILEKLTHVNYNYIISIHKVKKPEFINKQLYLYATLQECFLKYLNHFYIDPNLIHNTHQSINNILNYKDVIIKIDNKLLEYLAHYSSDLYNILGLNY